jgi:hypothetical protein
MIYFSSVLEQYHLPGLQGVDVHVQPSKLRVFSNQEYERAGAKISEDLRYMRTRSAKRDAAAASHT